MCQIFIINLEISAINWHTTREILIHQLEECQTTFDTVSIFIDYEIKKQCQNGIGLTALWVF